MKKILAAAIAIATLGLVASTSQASFIVNYAGPGPTPNVYNYDLQMIVTQPNETLFNGDEITLYDVAPASDILSVTGDIGLQNFTVTISNTGGTPAGLASAAGLHDDPTLANITLTWNSIGPLAGGNTGQQTFGDVFTITMAPGYAGTHWGQAASSTTVDVPPYGTTPGLYQGDQSAIYVVQLPTAVPEPASLSLLALAAPALLKRRRR